MKICGVFLFVVIPSAKVIAPQKQELFRTNSELLHDALNTPPYVLVKFLNLFGIAGHWALQMKVISQLCEQAGCVYDARHSLSQKEIPD
jgi:hypothetical protein